MTGSTMDLILGMVTPDMRQALASRLGESLEGVQSGLGAATAATLSGLARKAAADGGFLGQIVGLLEGSAGQRVVASLPLIASSGSTDSTGDVINRFVPMVFGAQQGEVASAISQRAGLSAGSGLGLLKMAASLVLAYFAEVHSAGSLTVSSLGNMLQAEAPALHGYLPASLLPGAPDVATSISSRAPLATRRAPARTPWLVPLALAGALLLAWLLIRSLSGPRPPTRTAANVTNEAATTAGDTARAAWAALGDMMRVKLPDGSELNVPSLGVEAKLVKFLNERSAPVPDNSGFDFDRLLFDSGQATLQAASQEQLTNIAAILKAYPHVKVRIGGYTDNSGDPAANLQLSQQRADNVMAELTRLGVDPSRLSAKGYGQENPVADNATEAGRQKNRRISLQVTEKPGSAA